MPTTLPANDVARGSDFAALSQRISAAGLMRRRPGYYTVKIAVTVAAYAAVWVAFVAVGDSWWQLLVAAALAIMFAQLGFLGHDIGHRQAFASRRVSEVAGLLVGDLAVGLSYGWWVGKHTRHHANPNHEDHDPDVGVGALVWTQEQARGRRGALAVLSRWQAWLFFPLLTLEGLQLHASSVQAVLGRQLKRRGTEAVLIALHLIGYVGGVFLVLPPVKALVFLAVSQGLFGLYLGCAFAPNHKGMQMLTAQDELDFLRRQVLTSRNVRGGRFVDLVLGGLNYQIEHHLFPSMPRPNLRLAQPIVRDYCRELEISYEETGAVDSYRQALRHLHAVGAPLRG